LRLKNRKYRKYRGVIECKPAMSLRTGYSSFCTISRLGRVGGGRLLPPAALPSRRSRDGVPLRVEEAFTLG
jgi:hypothetical protein